MSDRDLQPPHNLDAERAVLGSLLLGPSECNPEPVLARLSPDDLYLPQHRAIFQACVAVHAGGGAIEPVAVEAQLGNRDPRLFGLPALIALSDGVATASNVMHHAKMVRSKAAARELMRVGEQMAKASAEEDADAAELLEQARKRIEILTGRLEGRGARRGPTAVDPMEVLSMHEAPQRIYSTGLAQLDHLLGGGLRASTLTVLAAPPGSGKTSWCVGLARRLSGQLPVLWVSLEITEREMAARLAAHAMGEKVRDILDCRIDHREAAQAIRGERVRVVRIRPYDPDAGDPLGLIAEQARQLAKSMGDTPAIILDYLQLVAQVGAQSFDKARDGVAATAYRCMHLAESLGVPVIAVSSVSRGHYGAPRKGQTDRDAIKDPRDYISASKDAGEIEFAAANMLFLEVASAVDPQGEQAVRMAVAKARHGRTDWVGLRFDGARGSFRVDPKATEELGPARRAMEDEARILDLVRTAKAPMNRTELKGKAGFDGNRALATIVRLLEGEDPRLVEVETRRLNTNGRPYKVKVCRLPEQVEQTDLDLDS
jgi:replicative DNA helicase